MPRRKEDSESSSDDSNYSDVGGRRRLSEHFLLSDLLNQSYSRAKTLFDQLDEDAQARLREIREEMIDLDYKREKEVKDRRRATVAQSQRAASVSTPTSTPALATRKSSTSPAPAAPKQIEPVNNSGAHENTGAETLLNILQSINLIEDFKQLDQLIESEGREEGGVMSMDDLNLNYEVFQTIVTRSSKKNTERRERLVKSLGSFQHALRQQVELLVHEYKVAKQYYKYEHRIQELEHNLVKSKAVLAEKRYQLKIQQGSEKLSVDELRQKFEKETEELVRSLISTINNITNNANALQKKCDLTAKEKELTCQDMGELLHLLEQEEKNAKQQLLAQQQQHQNHPHHPSEQQVGEEEQESLFEVFPFLSEVKGDLGEEEVWQSQQIVNLTQTAQTQQSLSLTKVKEDFSVLRERYDEMLQSEEKKALERLKKMIANTQDKLKEDGERAKMLERLVGAIQAEDAQNSYVIGGKRKSIYSNISAPRSDNTNSGGSGGGGGGEKRGGGRGDEERAGEWRGDKSAQNNNHTLTMREGGGRGGSGEGKEEEGGKSAPPSAPPAPEHPYLTLLRRYQGGETEGLGGGGERGIEGGRRRALGEGQGEALQGVVEQFEAIGGLFRTLGGPGAELVPYTPLPPQTGRGATRGVQVGGEIVGARGGKGELFVGGGRRGGLSLMPTNYKQLRGRGRAGAGAGDGGGKERGEGRESSPSSSSSSSDGEVEKVRDEKGDADDEKREGEKEGEKREETGETAASPSALSPASHSKRKPRRRKTKGSSSAVSPRGGATDLEYLQALMEEEERGQFQSYGLHTALQQVLSYYHILTHQADAQPLSPDMKDTQEVSRAIFDPLSPQILSATSPTREMQSVRETAEALQLEVELLVKQLKDLYKQSHAVHNAEKNALSDHQQLTLQFDHLKTQLYREVDKLFTHDKHASLQLDEDLKDASLELQRYKEEVQEGRVALRFWQEKIVKRKQSNALLVQYFDAYSQQQNNLQSIAKCSSSDRNEPEDWLSYGARKFSVLPQRVLVFQEMHSLYENTVKELQKALAVSEEGDEVGSEESDEVGKGKGGEGGAR